VLSKFPERIIEKAVKGMLPKNKLGAALFRNLKVYAGSEHNHDAQKPVSINLNDLK
jgi:ribosomal protein L13